MMASSSAENNYPASAAAARKRAIDAATTNSAADAKAKTVLKEAVDAVVNSFAKHTHGYGRGEHSKTLNN